MTNGSTGKKVAVVGTGYWGRNLVRNFFELGALRLVADPNPETLAAITNKYPGLLGVQSLEEVLNDSEIQAVALATPAPSHASLAIKVLESGRDVFVEKPLCLSVADSLAMVKKAEENGRILMVDHLLNRHPAVIRLREMVLSGEMGRIQYIFSRRLNFGKIQDVENVLWSLSPHDISLIINILGDYPTSVFASGGNFLTPGIVDMAEVTLKFGGGIVAHISASWLNPFKEHRLVVVGQEKMAVFDDTLPWSDKLTVYPHRVKWNGRLPEAVKGEGQKIVLEEREPLKDQCSAFLEGLESRKLPTDSDGRAGLWVISVLEAMDRSLATGACFQLPITEIVSEAFVHPTAQVDQGAIVGKGSKIWHFSHVLGGSVVGENCNIGQNVVIGPRAKVGRGSKIQNNVSVYEGVELEEGVFCGPSMVFTNVNNPRAFISRMHEIRPTIVKRGASIGANATIVCGHTLGEFSFVAAGSVVTSDVPAYARMIGVPARQVGWICRCGEKLPDSLKCPACGLAYYKDGEILAPVDPKNNKI